MGDPTHQLSLLKTTETQNYSPNKKMEFKLKQSSAQNIR